jgi:hypothetical protein
MTTYTPDSLRRARRLAAMMSLVAAVAACDNPVTPDHHEEDVHGVSILQGETEVARYFEGEISGELPDVAAGEEGPLLTIVFLDHDGEAVDVEAEEGVSLRARTANAEIADFEVVGFAGRVQGVAEGATTIIFDLMHGGHADFSTLGFPVTVLAAP